MKKTILLLACLAINVIVFSQHLQLKTQPQIWLRADSAGNSLNSWSDASGNNLNAFTATGQILPDTVLFNFNRAYLMDSLAKPLMIPYKSKGTENLTVLTVYHTSLPQTELGLWCIKLDTAKNTSLTTQKIQSFKTRVNYADSTFTRAIINTTMPKWKNLHIDTLNSYILLGGSDSLNYSGKLAEFLLFRTTLKGKDLQKVHTYLAIKYGISLYQSDYLDSKDSIIWNYQQNINYSKEIAGIGKDTLLNTNQKQSSANGGEDILTIGAGTIAKTTIQNQYPLNQGDFLIWSNNGAELTKKGIDTIPDLISNVSDKKWMMNVKGITANTIPTQITLDVSKFDSVGRCVLLINRDTNENFLAFSTEIYQSDSTDTITHKVYFSNINWDTDMSGNDIFTFLLGNKLTLLATTPDQPPVNNPTANYSAKLDVMAGTPPFIYTVFPDSLPENIITWTSNDSIEYMHNLNSGIYTAIVTDVKGAKDTKKFKIGQKNKNMESSLHHPSDSNNNNDNNNTITENRFSVYPNPANKNFTIEIQLKQKESIRLRYLDTQGKLILEKTLSGSDYYFLNESIKQSGSYFIEIATIEETKIFKLIIN